MFSHVVPLGTRARDQAGDSAGVRASPRSKRDGSGTDRQTCGARLVGGRVLADSLVDLAGAELAHANAKLPIRPPDRWCREIVHGERMVAVHTPDLRLHGTCPWRQPGPTPEVFHSKNVGGESGFVSTSAGGLRVSPPAEGLASPGPVPHYDIPPGSVPALCGSVPRGRRSGVWAGTSLPQTGPVHRSLLHGRFHSARAECGGGGALPINGLRGFPATDFGTGGPQGKTRTSAD